MVFKPTVESVLIDVNEGVLGDVYRFIACYFHQIVDAELRKLAVLDVEVFVEFLSLFLFIGLVVGGSTLVWSLPLHIANVAQYPISRAHLANIQRQPPLNRSEGVELVKEPDLAFPQSEAKEHVHGRHEVLRYVHETQLAPLRDFCLVVKLLLGLQTALIQVEQGLLVFREESEIHYRFLVLKVDDALSVAHFLAVHLGKCLEHDRERRGVLDVDHTHDAFEHLIDGVLLARQQRCLVFLVVVQVRLESDELDPVD